MISGKHDFFFILSLILIYSNKFSFIIASCKAERVEQLFSNTKGHQLYKLPSDLSDYFRGDIENILPPDTDRVEELYSTDSFIQRRLAVAIGNTHLHLDELTIKIPSVDETDNSLIAKIAFTESFTLKYY